MPFPTTKFLLRSMIVLTVTAAALVLVFTSLREEWFWHLIVALLAAICMWVVAWNMWRFTITLIHWMTTTDVAPQEEVDRITKKIDDFITWCIVGMCFMFWIIAITFAI